MKPTEEQQKEITDFIAQQVLYLRVLEGKGREAALARGLKYFHIFQIIFSWKNKEKQEN